MLYCNTALLFSMHPAVHSMAAGLTAITRLSVCLCVYVCLTPHCGLWVQEGIQGDVEKVHTGDIHLYGRHTQIENYTPNG